MDTHIKKAVNPAQGTAQIKKDGNNRIKGTHSQRHIQQERYVFEYLFLHPSTMKEADRATGVMRENICWAVWHFRKNYLIYEVGKRLCTVTNHRATVFTTNPELAPTPDANQLKMF